ncbi:uncharacterized protein PV09_08969 [Verruconis gallopava]|uniref:BSD domain-containing protein n=1 Tax=Verruconis gallopava TaxID=253628 RepID=A0A0D2AK21_9PEZI|nr:uncharacterized protein PV09_08969 [Verruconis gallopava]KIV99308.1 hypothetical protein PV09_08969 [Verruconis gallopava]
MDVAYDHIQEESFPEDEENTKSQHKGEANNDSAPQTINQDLRDAYKAFTSSPWGMKLGGLWSSAKKQGEQYYATAQHEASELLSRTRAISLSSPPTSPKPNASTSDQGAVEDSAPAERASETHPDRPDSLPVDIYKEASKSASSLASRLRSEAARRLKEAQKLEDAADEQLLQWGTSIGNFFKDAISIAPPSTEDLEKGKGEVLFASKDAEGKRVVHATRLDAQLHVIHCSLDSFLKDPKSGEWEKWKAEFDVEKRTDDIAKDLETYEQLREAMGKLVPEQVEYKDFWCRYYFLRHVVETEEARRRELLKGAAITAEEEVGWDESDDEESTTPKHSSSSSSSKPAAKDDSDNATLKPSEPRRSNDEKSTAGSDASYDIVSGATSRAPGSPTADKKAEDSDDDWE